MNDKSELKDFLMSDPLKKKHKQQRRNRKKYSMDSKKYKLVDFFKKVVIPIKMRHYYKHKKELEKKLI